MTSPENVHASTERAPSTHGRRTLRFLGGVETAAVSVAAACGTIAAVASESAATGIDSVDAAYRFLMVGAAAILAVRARPWSWVVASCLVVPLAADATAFVIGVTALGLAMFGSFSHRRDSRLFGALVGGLVGLASLDLVDGGRHGASAVAAAGAVGVLAVSGIVNMSPRLRRLVTITVTAGAVVAALLTVAGASAVLTARSSLIDGAQEARAGLGAFRDGRDEDASLKLASAIGNFESSESVSATVWGRAGLLVPVLSQHLRAVNELSAEGVDLASTVSRSAEQLEVGGLTRDGRIDLDRVAAFVPQAEALIAGIEGTQTSLDEVSSPWLVAPLQEAMAELDGEMSDSLPQVVDARDALIDAPELFGGNGPRIYLTIVANPAEARELGGFAGSFGLLTMNDGAFEFDVISARELKDALRDAGATAPPDLPPPLVAGRPERFPQNWTAWHDFGVVADVSVDLIEQALGLRVDGVLYADAYVFASLLEFTGPLRLDDVPYRIARPNAVDFLLRDQYQFFTDGQVERKELMGDLADAAFDRLSAGGLPEPRRLANRLGPLVNQRRLLFRPTASDPSHDYLDRIGITGVTAVRPGAPLDPVVDEILVTHTNLRSNKLDAYLSRVIDYRLTVSDADATAAATVRVEVTNGVPADGLDDYVLGDGPFDLDGLPDRLSRIEVTVHSSMNTESITVDGAPAPSNSLLVDRTWRHSTVVEVPPGETVVIEVALRGMFDPDIEPVVRFSPNGSAVPDRLSASVERAGRRETLAQFVMSGPVELRLPSP